MYCMCYDCVIASVLTYVIFKRHDPNTFILLSWHNSYNCYTTFRFKCYASFALPVNMCIASSWQDLNSWNTLATHLKLNKKRTEQSKVYWHYLPVHVYISASDLTTTDRQKGACVIYQTLYYRSLVRSFVVCTQKKVLNKQRISE